MSQLSGRELAKARSVFGMLFQNAALFDDLTVFDNVAFPLYEHTKLSKSEIEDRVSRSLKLLDMNKGYDKYPNELSGGMKKRVGLARAIIREPSILLYDEPTTGLDPVTRMTVDDLIARLKEELALTSVVISHDIPSALRLGDQVVFLHGGKAIFHDEPSHFVKADHEVIRKFLDAEHRTVDSFASLA